MMLVLSKWYMYAIWYNIIFTNKKFLEYEYQFTNKKFLEYENDSADWSIIAVIGVRFL